MFYYPPIPYRHSLAKCYEKLIMKNCKWSHKFRQHPPKQFMTNITVAKFWEKELSAYMYCHMFFCIVFFSISPFWLFLNNSNNLKIDFTNPGPYLFIIATIIGVGSCSCCSIASSCELYGERKRQFDFDDDDARYNAYKMLKEQMIPDIQKIVDEDLNLNKDLANIIIYYIGEEYIICPEYVITLT